MNKPRIGQKIVITSDNDNYKKYLDKEWKITQVSYSTDDHPGYDDGVNARGSRNKMALVDCEGLDFSLYEWEFDIV